MRGCMARASSVMRTALPVRSNSRQPSRSSISATCAESAGWVTPTASAARPKCSACASASKYCIWRTVILIIRKSYRNEQERQFVFIAQFG